MTTSKAKARGSATERAVAGYLREQGWPHAERLYANGRADRGDIAGIPGVCVEVKSGTTDLAGWLGEVAAEVANSGAQLGVVWHRRRGKGSPGDWYVTMTGADLVALLDAAGYRPQEESR